MGTRRKSDHTPDPATENLRTAVATLQAHPLFAPLWQHTCLVREPHNLCPPTGWAVLTTNGYLHVHPTRRAEPAEWVFRAGQRSWGPLKGDRGGGPTATVRPPRKAHA